MTTTNTTDRTERRSMSMSPDMWQAIKIAAAQDGITMTEWLRRAVSAKLWAEVNVEESAK